LKSLYNVEFEKFGTSLELEISITGDDVPHFTVTPVVPQRGLTP
jgi:hypothetical protein